MNREDIVYKINKNGIIGVELGVAEGEFSEKLLKTQKFKYLYSVDRYTGEGGVTEKTKDLAHDVEQYVRALKRLEKYKESNTILRMNFEEAIKLFEDETFDFIYIDGYAHTGENEGKTLHEWWPKLKKGGLFCGDDYHKDWPKVIYHVDEFCKKNGVEMKIHDYNNKDIIYSKYPSWYVIKK